MCGTGGLRISKARAALFLESGLDALACIAPRAHGSVTLVARWIHSRHYDGSVHKRVLPLQRQSAPRPHLPRAASQCRAPTGAGSLVQQPTQLKVGWKAEARALGAINRDQQLEQWHFLSDLAGEIFDCWQKGT